jgi:type VI secretion system secreted protein VgrG
MASSHGIQLDARLQLGSDPARSPELTIRGCRIDERISGRTTAVVDVSSAEHVDFEPWLGGEPIRLALEGDAGGRAWSLRLGEARYAGRKTGAPEYQLTFHDVLWPLGLGLSTRKFRNASAEQIVCRVLDQHGVRHELRLAHETPVRKYTAQYREDDLGFVERLLESEGIYYVLRSDGGVILADTSSSSPRLPGPPLELVEGADALEHGTPSVVELRRGRRVLPGRVTVADYNWKNPELDLRQSAFGDRDAGLEDYHYPAGFRRPEQGARLARLRLEALRARARFLEGAATILALSPALAFAMGGAAGRAFAGEYLVERVRHEARMAGDAAGVRALSYRNRFTALPLDAPFRPALARARPTVSGVHTAIVRGPAGEEIHTDAHGRFRAEFHWDREASGTDDDSRWLRLLQETSTSMAVARTGWEMYVGYVDGDPDRPIGLARAMNAVAQPSHELPAHKNRMAVRTPSSPATGGYSELSMDDSAGAQSMQLRAERNLDVAVKNDKTERIGHDDTHVVGDDRARRVLGNATLTVARGSTVTVGGNEKLLVQGSRGKTVAGDETIGAGATHRIAVAGDDRERVGSVRLTLAGGIRKPDFRALARSAGRGLLAAAAPGAVGAADALQSLRRQADTLRSTLSQSPLSAPLAAARGGAVAGALEGLAAGGAAGAAGGARAGAEQSLSGSLSGLLPDQRTLASLVPSKSWVPSGGAALGAAESALEQAKAGWSEANVDRLLAMLAVGGIERTAAKSMTRKVGGAWITAALVGIDTQVGFGLVETVGAIKLTVARNDVKEEVSGPLLVTVGGTVMRTAAGLVTIGAGTSSAIHVGATASYAADKLTLSADVVRIAAGKSLSVGCGAGCLSLKPDRASITGELQLEAGGDVVLSGGKRLDTT